MHVTHPPPPAKQRRRQTPAPEQHHPTSLSSHFHSVACEFIGEYLTGSEIFDRPTTSTKRGEAKLPTCPWKKPSLKTVLLAFVRRFIMSQEQPPNASLPSSDYLGALIAPPPASYAVANKDIPALPPLGAAGTSAAPASGGGAAATAFKPPTTHLGDDGHYGYGKYGSYYDYNYSDGGDDYGEEAYLKATATASGKLRNSNSSSCSGKNTPEKKKNQEVIDLDNQSDSDDDVVILGGGSYVTKPAAAAAATPKKRKRDSKKKAPPPLDAGYAERVKDAIAVDDDDDGKVVTHTKEEAKLAAYRSSLGPLRMEFVPRGVVKHHTYENGVAGAGYYGAGALGGKSGGYGRSKAKATTSTMNKSSKVKIR